MTKWLLPLLILGVLAGVLLFAPSRTDTPDEVPAEPQNVAVDSAYALPARWDDLSVGAFLNEASGALVVRYPETVTSLGLGGLIGTGDGDLMPLTVAYRNETHALEAAVVDRLATYDLDEASKADRLSASVYGSFLGSSVAGHPFADHEYAVSPSLTSYPQSLERFLTTTHPIATERNATDYLQRLSQIETRYAELTDGLERSEAIGAVPPRFLVEMTVGILRDMASVSPTTCPLYTTFEERLAAVTSISETRRAELLSQAGALIETSVLPAYEQLADWVADLAGRAPYEDGVWKMEDGDAYYAYLLNYYTTTDLTADEIHEIGLAEVARIQAEIRDVAASLGYDTSLSMAEIFARAREESGSVTGEETVTACEEIVEQIEGRVASVFHRFPSQELEVVAGDASAFYSHGSLDGTRPGLFYAPAGIETPRYRLPTLVHHEAIPGHHFQISFAHEVDIPPYRAGLSFTAYAEGWALYAERLAWELGAYDDDPYGNLGRLQDELFRAARLVVDTGLHAKRWTFQQAVDSMVESTGLALEYVQGQISRYILLPGQATAYKIGMLKFIELRERAEAQLGERFDLADFHDCVLREGSVPLDVLEELVDAYIAETPAER